MNRKIEQILASLKERFPEAVIAAERTMTGVKVPMIQLLLEAASLRHEMGSRWRLSETYHLRWYPADEKEVLTGAEPMLLAAKEIWPRAEVNVSRDGNTLVVEAESEEICFLTGEEAEKMKRELLTLQLKWQEEARKG
ncbi:MAG: hypothetical protein IJD13_01425 [Oscillospiraceae bacterium]|nr:hypothetical protein [Oscillospiraceae bacterium]